MYNIGKIMIKVLQGSLGGLTI